MQADYTAQLQAIATALKQTEPWWRNAWLLAALSATLGVVGGFVGQILQAIYQTRVVRRTLLSIGYGYVGQLLAALDVLLSSPGYGQHHNEALGIVLPIVPDDYARAHFDVYATLEESVVFDAIFAMGRKLLTGSEEYNYIDGTVQAIVLHFIANRLTLDNLEKYRNAEEAETFKNMLAKHEPRVRALYWKP